MTTEQDEDTKKRWNLQQLRQDVERLFGDQQLRIINQCLRTIGDRRAFARYHHGEAISKMDAVTQHDTEAELTAALMGAFDTDELSFSGMRFEASAHVIACVQNMHAIVDNMVHFVYYALGLNLDTQRAIKKERAINWQNVRDKLPPGPIKSGLTSLSDEPGFTYLSALSNHSKHRSIVEVDYSINFHSDTHGLRFTPFSYDGIHYPAAWVRPTLRDEYQRQEDLILRIGKSVNTELASRPDSHPSSTP